MAEVKGRFQTAVSSPVSKRGDDVIHLHGEDIPDPYRHLGNFDASSTKAWLQAQEEIYRRFIGTPKAETKQSLTNILNAPKKGIPTRAGEHYLFYYQAAEDNNPRVTISDTAEGVGRTLLDPREVDPSGISEITNVSISPDEKYIGYVIRKSRTEATLSVKNIETGEDLPDVVKNTANGMNWDKDGRGFSYNVYDDTNHGKIKHHILGTDAAEDTLSYDGTDQAPFVALTSDSPVMHKFYQGHREWLFTGGMDAKKSLSLKDRSTGEYHKIFDAGVAIFEPIADTKDGVLMLTTHNAPRGKVVLFDPDNPAPENWKPVIPEGETDRLKYMFRHQDKLVGLYSHNCADQVRIFDLQGKSLGDVPLPTQSSVWFSHATLPGISLGAGRAGYRRKGFVYERHRVSTAADCLSL